MGNFEKAWGVVKNDDDIQYDKSGSPFNSQGQILCEIEAEKGRAIPATYRICDHVCLYFSESHYDEVKRMNTTQDYEPHAFTGTQPQEDLDEAVKWWDTHIEHKPEGWITDNPFDFDREGDLEEWARQRL